MLIRDRRPTAPTGRTYSGAWRSATTYSDRALPPGPGVDPSHMRPDAPDPGQVWAGHPRTDHAPQYLTQESDDAYSMALDTLGLVLDGEPITHDAGDPQTYHPAPIPGAESRPPDVAAHALDRGAQLRQSYEEPQMRGSQEEPRTERWQNAPVQRGSTVASLRGANSLPDNNPEGFPTGTGDNGHLIKRFYHRIFPHERFVHNERPLRPNTAARATDSPAMTREQSNRYTSPFAWRSFYGTRARQVPMLRRNPPDSQTVDATSDGSDSLSDVPADWVIG